MSKAKLFTLMMLSGGFVMALGINCLPNVGNVFGGLLNGILG